MLLISSPQKLDCGEAKHIWASASSICNVQSKYKPEREALPIPISRGQRSEVRGRLTVFVFCRRHPTLVYFQSSNLCPVLSLSCLLQGGTSYLAVSCTQVPASSGKAVRLTPVHLHPCQLSIYCSVSCQMRKSSSDQHSVQGRQSPSLTYKHNTSLRR